MSRLRRVHTWNFSVDSGAQCMLLKLNALAHSQAWFHGKLFLNEGLGLMQWLVSV